MPRGRKNRDMGEWTFWIPDGESIVYNDVNGHAVTSDDVEAIHSYLRDKYGQEPAIEHKHRTPLSHRLYVWRNRTGRFGTFDQWHYILRGFWRDM